MIQKVTFNVVTFSLNFGETFLYNHKSLSSAKIFSGTMQKNTCYAKKEISEIEISYYRYRNTNLQNGFTYVSKLICFLCF